jgi:hypothetical protein
VQLDLEIAHLLGVPRHDHDIDGAARGRATAGVLTVRQAEALTVHQANLPANRYSHALLFGTPVLTLVLVDGRGRPSRWSRPGSCGPRPDGVAAGAMLVMALVE